LDSSSHFHIVTQSRNVLKNISCALSDGKNKITRTSSLESTINILKKHSPEIIFFDLEIVCLKKYFLDVCLSETNHEFLSVPILKDINIESINELRRIGYPLFISNHCTEVEISGIVSAYKKSVLEKNIKDSHVKALSLELFEKKQQINIMQVELELLRDRQQKDELTGLSSLDYCVEQIKNKPFSIACGIFINIRRFNEINQKKGYKNSNEILIATGKAIEKYSKKNLGVSALVCRVVADKFFVFIVQNDIEKIAKFCQNMNFAVRTTLTCELSIAYSFINKNLDIKGVVAKLEADLKSSSLQGKYLLRKSYL